MKLEHAIYCGDNLDWMKKMPDEFVDLCYIDPPFFSNKKYEVIFNDGEEIRAFEDRWKGGIEHYIEWMKDRIFEIHRVLKKTGSFYLHCDWHAGHYLRVMLDEIFGYHNFRNEIIWHYRRWTGKSDRFQRLHDTIFFYTKGDKNIFHIPYTPYTEKSLYRKQWYHTRIKGNDVYKTKVDERGVRMGDVWNIPVINSQAKERLGYPTQKPEMLLIRIIKASSNEGDLVFDPFCGCGTTLVVAEMLKRKWLGIDVSPTACRLMKRRLSTVTRKPIEIVGVRYDLEELKTFKPFEFQNWVIGALGGTTSERKVKDMGIDGYTFMERNPIQVKQSESVGRVVVDNFETALRRIKKEKGIIVGFSFTKDAYEEVARVKRANHLDITLMTVEDVRKQLQSSN
jgi:DNA modification methylase